MIPPGTDPQTDDRPTSVQIGERIRRLRQAKGLSQGELAVLLDRSQAAISQWESGRRSPSVDDLLEVASTLEAPMSELVPDVRGVAPVPALLRAQVAQLDDPTLIEGVDALLLEAQELPPLEPLIQISADTPIRAAQQALSRGGVTGVPIDIEDLARSFGARVLRYRLRNALSGLVVRLDHGPVIAVNDRHSEVRQRFTIAHELGHLLLGHGAKFYIDMLSRPEDGDPPGYDARHEREANEFAANVLMPAASVRERFGVTSAIDELAPQFEVSDMAMRYRLANLGLR